MTPGIYFSKALLNCETKRIAVTVNRLSTNQHCNDTFRHDLGNGIDEKTTGPKSSEITWDFFFLCFRLSWLQFQRMHTTFYTQLSDEQADPAARYDHDPGFDINL